MPVPRSGAAGLAYAAGIEVRSFTLRRVEIPCLPAGARPIRVLHVSDLHLTPDPAQEAGVAALAGRARAGPGRQHRRQPRAPRRGAADRWTPSARCSTCPGVFVFGSNDYYAPTLRNPVWYLFPDDGRRQHAHAEAAVSRTCATAFTDARLARPEQRERPARRARARRSRSRASTTRTCGSTTWPRWPARRRPMRTCGSASRTRRTCGCWTSSPTTGTTLTFAGPHPRRPAVPAVLRRAGHQLRPRHRPGQGAAPAPGRLAARRRRARPGCTCPPAPAPRRTRQVRFCCRPEATLLTADARVDGGRDRPHDAAGALVRATRSGSGRLPNAFGLWRSLVARLVRDEEAAGSNPVSPTV